MFQLSDRQTATLKISKRVPHFFNFGHDFRNAFNNNNTRFELDKCLDFLQKTRSKKNIFINDFWLLKLILDFLYC